MCREFARLGEHDIRTEDDGPHQDVKVVHTESHGNYIRRQGLNDIGILYLERDVDFTGRIQNFNFSKFYYNFKNL